MDTAPVSVWRALTAERRRNTFAVLTRSWKMRTYPSQRESDGRVTAFEIENVYASPGTIARILRGIDSVSDVRKRRPFSAFDEFHIRFCFRGVECVVWEPFGDNSRYWIGPRNVPEPLDLTLVEQAFRDYSPPIHRKLIGDIVTLHFVRKLLGRDDKPQRPINPPPT